MMKILIVDDQSENLYLMQSLLESQGHEVFSALNGQIALEMMNRSAMDLVISDILMPVMDGFSFCREVRKNAVYSHIPFIIYTATYTGEQDEDLARRIGADGFIVKPCEPEEFLSRIKVIVENKQKSDHSATPAGTTEHEILKLYNERLVRKLEQKMLELEKEIEAREKALEALQRNEELLKSTQALGKMGGWEYDVSSGKLFWTDELYLLHDIDPADPEASELVFRSLECFPEDSQVTIKAAIDEMIARGTPYKIESWFTSRKGRKLWVRNTAQGIFKDGKLVRANGIIQDITESKEAQTKQEELAEQLRQAQKLDTIGQLAGGVAHDFNNVLTVILGYAEDLLQNLNAQDPIYTDIQEILSAGNRASSLTRQLLTFSRKQIIQPQVMNINDAVNNLYKMLVRLIGEDIQFEIDLADDLPPILADVGNIEQVIMNLVINAREAMQLGGKLNIFSFSFDVDDMFTSQHPAMRPGRYAILKVTDTGTGMTKEIKERIFEPFYTTKGVGRGTGLGLATVYGIVRQAGGFINVDTAPGKGTSFVIMIPAVEAEIKASDSTRKTGDTMGHSEQVLVVEDDPAISELTSKIIEKLGYQVRNTDSADKAMAMIEDEGFHPDLLVTDVVMPGLSGLELAAILRFKYPSMKFLLMSGYTESVISRHGDRDPNLPFIQKPFTRNDLAEKIRLALES
ncbi:MAG TPA: response regulator [Candidatus Cloacimonadota bacterium]|nr:response regulator [Candidatus Cloacimonadota bacterium]